MTAREVRTITQRLSLRKPQADSLELLGDLLNAINLGKDMPLAPCPRRRAGRMAAGAGFRAQFPLCLLQPRDGRRQDAADGRLYHLSVPDATQPAFLRAGAEQDHLRQADRRLHAGTPQIRIQGYRGVRAEPAADHHRRQLRERHRRADGRRAIRRPDRLRHSREHLQRRQDQQGGKHARPPEDEASAGDDRRQLLQLPVRAEGSGRADGRGATATAPVPGRVRSTSCGRSSGWN